MAPEKMREAASGADNLLFFIKVGLFKNDILLTRIVNLAGNFLRPGLKFRELLQKRELLVERCVQYFH